MYSKSAAPTVAHGDGGGGKDKPTDDADDDEAKKLRERIHNLGESLQAVKKCGDSIAASVQTGIQAELDAARKL
eukprot:5320794-Pyramimonas_sp.AAC.1